MVFAFGYCVARSSIDRRHSPTWGSGEVVGGGCSGLQYRWKSTPRRNADKVFERDGAKLIVDKKSFLYLNGSQLDYAEELMSSGFRLVNPNAKRSCGCGESFTDSSAGEKSEDNPERRTAFRHIRRGSCSRAHDGQRAIMTPVSSPSVHTVNDSPHPQLRLAFGLTSLNPDDISPQHSQAASHLNRESSFYQHQFRAVGVRKPCRVPSRRRFPCGTASPSIRRRRPSP